MQAIHKARVASRRLRELLPVLQLDPHTAEKIEQRLRRATRRLGEVRELDVLLGVVDEMRAGHEPAPRRVLLRMAGDIRRARVEALTGRAAREMAAELQRIARKLDAAMERLRDQEGVRSTDRAWRWAADARVARRAGAARDAIQAAGALYAPEALHELRIALKKFRYALEVAQEASGQTRRGELQALKRAQDLLGRLHDLQVLEDRARGAQASAGTPSLAAWREYDALLNVLEQDCRRLHARFVTDRTAVLAVCDKHAARHPPAKHAGRRAG